MEAGLARQRDPEGMKFRPVVELTGAGVAVMKGEQLPPISLADLLPRRAPAPAASTSFRRISSVRPDVDDAGNALSPEAMARFDRLRALRTQIAKQKQLPPYCICHDSTLKLIAFQAPADIEALEQVKGMGPYKVKMYGQAFLDAVRAERA